MKEAEKRPPWEGKKPNNVRMRVKITQITGEKWYKVGEVHEVGCYITLAYCGGPSYEKSKGFNGIDITDCKIIEVLPNKSIRKSPYKIW